jgi:two-component system sensor histidine kinase/response regulator
MKDLTSSEGNEDRFRLLVEAVQDYAIYMLDVDGRVSTWNIGAERNKGYKGEEILGEHFSRFFQASEIAAGEPQRILSIATATGRYEGQGWRLRKDGTRFFASVVVNAIRDAEGRLLGFAKITRDLTERLLQEERCRKILSSSFDAFLQVCADGHITSWNLQAEKTFGWTEFETSGLHLKQLIEIDGELESTAIEGVDSLSRFFSSSRGSPLQARFEVTARHKTGVTFPAEMTISTISTGDRTNFAAFVRNVTERKLAEQRLIESREAAEAASRAKSEFLANMSHEIRTPLNGVIGMTDLALGTELTREQRDYLEIVKLSADSLLSVINDILDFSKIEAGKMDLEEIRYDLRDCLESAAKTLALRADEKGLELLCDISPTIPDTLLGDPGRVRQITTNLLSNAIKFTVEGEVCLRVSTRAAPSGEEELHFMVSDTGIGIAPEKLRTIFESFSQADTSTTRFYGGTGLGLTISKHLVEQMGGEVWTESELGKGSHFQFTIPLKKAEMLERAPEVGAAYRTPVGTKVLVIDDNKTNRQILDGLLKAWGMEVTAVCDGPSALAHLTVAQEAGEPYRLILTDAHMPEMDGFEVIERIRQNSALSVATIIMLSSGGHGGDAAKCQTLGVAGYLLKPVRQTELRDAIARATGTIPASGTTSMARENRVEQSASRFLSILLAEDNLVNRTLGLRLLEKRGHTVVIAENGCKAVDLLKRETFDLVLMDVQMPEMDGIRATNIIRGCERGTERHQPIVAMTALATAEDRQRCLAAQMDGYLSKPIRADQLDEVLNRYTQKKQQ